MTYDQWKDPTPYEEDPECDACEYDEYDDPLTGRVSCIHCGRSWYLTAEQMAANDARQRESDEAEEDERFRGFDPEAYQRAMIGKQPHEPLKDDELPF